MRANMLGRFSSGLLSGILLIGTLLATPYADVGAFQNVPAKTLAKDKFVFPDDLQPSGLNVLFIAISDDQETGERQGDVLREWHTQLAARGVFNDSARGYHFPVMAGVPFFVKGLVSRGMRKVYGENIPLDQVAILHVDSTADFASSIGVANDGKPTVMLATGAGEVLEVFHGYADEVDIADVASAIAGLSEPVGEGPEREAPGARSDERRDGAAHGAELHRERE